MADGPKKGAPLSGKGKSLLGLVLGAGLTVFCALYAVPVRQYRHCADGSGSGRDRL